VFIFDPIGWLMPGQTSIHFVEQVIAFGSGGGAGDGDARDGSTPEEEKPYKPPVMEFTIVSTNDGSTVEVVPVAVVTAGGGAGGSHLEHMASTVVSDAYVAVLQSGLMGGGGALTSWFSQIDFDVAVEVGVGVGVGVAVALAPKHFARQSCSPAAGKPE
jgi:hypothetical protein